MRIDTPKISEPIMEALRGATVEGNVVKFNCGNLGSAWAEVKELMEARLGGKWHRGKGGIVFTSNPATLLEAVIECGLMPEKNPTAYFPTPYPVIERLFRQADSADWSGDLRFLEPSAGGGAIADAVLKLHPFQNRRHAWTVDCCEILPANRLMLQRNNHNIVGDDFLEYSPGAIYDICLMNPPFSLPGDPKAYITHIMHAWELLKDGGTLASIVPTGWVGGGHDKRVNAFFDFVCLHGSWEFIDAGAFKESGTSIPTMAIGLCKESQEWRLGEYQGHENWYVWAAALYGGDTYETATRLATASQLPVGEREPKIREIYDEVARRAKKEVSEPIILGDYEHACLLRHTLEENDVAVDVLPVIETVKPTVVKAAPATAFVSQLDLFSEAA